MHDGVGALGHAQLLRSALGLGKVAAGHDDVPVAALGQRVGGVQAQAGGRAGDDGGGLLRYGEGKARCGELVNSQQPALGTGKVGLV